MNQIERPMGAQEPTRQDAPGESNFYLNLFLTVVLLFVISLCGVVANIFNLLVFCRQRRKDNVSSALIALGVTDFCLTTITLGFSCANMWKLIYPRTAVDPFSVGKTLIGWPMSMFYDISATIIVLISFERCFCVVSPFHAKHLMTPRRMLIAIGLIYVVSLLFFSPLILTQRLVWISNNQTRGEPRLLFWVNPRTESYRMALFYLKGVGTYTTAQVLVFCFSGVMIYSLKMSQSFRAETTSNAVQVNRRERSLMRMVLFIAIMFFISNTGAVMSSFAKILVPQSDSYDKYAYLYDASAQLLTLVLAANSSFNIVVYYTTSSRYRQGLKKLFKKD